MALSPGLSVFHLANGKAYYRIIPGSVYSNILTSSHDTRFLIDVRNTAVFTVGFIAGCLILGLGLAILLDQKLKGEALFRGIFLFPMSISFIASGVVWGWLMNPATGNRITGINLIFSRLDSTL